MSWFDKLMPSRIKTEQRKRSVPEGLWVKCTGCSAQLYRAELKRNLLVCPKCEHHMRIGARDRLEMFLDPDSGHELAANLEPQDPVTLGLCSQIDLDKEVLKAGERAERERRKLEKEMIKAGTLIPTEESTGGEKPAPVYAKIITAEEMARAAAEAEGPDLAEILSPGQAPDRAPQKEADSVFAKLGGSTVEKRPAEDT